MDGLRKMLSTLRARDLVSSVMTSSSDSCRSHIARKPTSVFMKTRFGRMRLNHSMSW